MGTLQGPVICPTLRAKQVSAHPVPINASFMAMLKSGIRGSKNVFLRSTNAGIFKRPLHVRRIGTIRCTFSSSSNGSGSRAENFRENDEDYVNSSVTEAVEVESGSDGFTIKMRDGRLLKCVHNSPQGGNLPDYAPHSAIVLKMEDGTDLLLPIVVWEMPSVLLMAAICNVHNARPTVYQVTKEMIEKMGYAVKLVRITKRVHEAYFAEIYLTKACLMAVVLIGEENDCISLDLRPSDAINIAVRCKASIQVNRNLAHSDGMRVVESAKVSAFGPASDGLLFTELDRPTGKPGIEATEFNLLRNMLDAAGEERYQDAAQWRNKLMQLRAKRNWA
ncbi:hypothetical protein Cgig2_004403 [Carnegiea gigantea]|uniref:BFN domain-containing protein n=1 Tax=Carnegiea gigantea TaxID=171969 RepID=A0A9Q1JRS0_9CARY|nr:hypothetical protein Cgig2_004403 [Carnegiea gigantea]